MHMGKIGAFSSRGICPASETLHREAILSPWDFPMCIFNLFSRDNILSNQFDSRLLFQTQARTQMKEAHFT